MTQKPLTKAQHKALHALWHQGPLTRRPDDINPAWQAPNGDVHSTIAVSKLCQRRMAKRTPDNAAIQITYTGLDYLKAKGDIPNGI